MVYNTPCIIQSSDNFITEITYTAVSDQGTEKIPLKNIEF